ncbi:Oidioi.mRNA.OKI2018_I69.chr2.g7321.t1.cds [Oikopleura dioica]|uniref:Oidioi.mRNA.OKI2018_I69.chr2.g7321.t1.cds n=1 Tax=Oikopleura dioica TaxID=34765 RepID=A0ABN7T697_OIKDI|nr:Oidioi.mRNA.OKI2018_I69.chr2.g7321.t1.cds [Oikopleura dioica]
MRNSASVSRSNDFETKRNVELSKLHMIGDVLIHVYRMIADQEYPDRWALNAACCQKAWFKLYLEEADRYYHHQMFSPRSMAAIGSIFAHSLRHMAKILNIYDEWTRNSLKSSLIYKLEQEESENLLDFWCEQEMDPRRRRELIQQCVLKTEIPPAALGHYYF